MQSNRKNEKTQIIAGRAGGLAPIERPETAGKFLWGACGLRFWRFEEYFFLFLLFWGGYY
ncbi:hypothetical protein [Acutalibacter caecimuris]|uniref:hypothetical protein n=1 Tax=Acutalibacter caecimuris TaxID=3093657 RepID=UPI002AC95DD7|nr:hypothetical protein [Acutalibacter sp. M00118]